MSIYIATCLLQYFLIRIHSYVQLDIGITFLSETIGSISNTRMTKPRILNFGFLKLKSFLILLCEKFINLKKYLSVSLGSV